MEDYIETVTKLSPVIHELKELMSESRKRYEADLAKRTAKRRALPPPNPEAWRTQLNDLIEAGAEDIVIGYWRVSSEEQQEGQGPDVQRQYICSWTLAHRKKAEPDLWVWDTESGTTGDRRGYLFLEEAAFQWQVTQIVCYSLDRFSR